MSKPWFASVGCDHPFSAALKFGRYREKTQDGRGSGRTSVRPKALVAWAAFSLGLLSSLPAIADTSTIITDRPDFTESAATVPEGLGQLELGVTAERFDGETFWTAGEALFRLGLSERWELRLTAPSHLSGPGPDGFGDGGIGAKLLIADEPRGARPATAVIVATSVPSGEAPFRSDAWQPEAKLCLSWDLGSGLGLAANLNVARPEDDGQRFDQVSGSLSLGVELAPRLGAFFEWFGYSAEVAEGDPTNYVNGGLTYRVTNDFQLDARIGRGLDSDTADFFAGLGAAIRF